MGISLYMLKDYDNANLNFKKAIDLNANDAITYLDFANSLAKQESYKDAVKKYQKAIELDPLLASAYSGLGHCLNRLDKLDEALIQLQKGESIKEGSCLYNLACGYALTNQKELCLAALEKLLKNELLYNESVTRDELENDPDFKNVKDLPGFIKLLDTYKPTKG
jgi:tetratricopeptide (TPR) repeat protein